VAGGEEVTDFPSVTLVAITPDAESLIARSARTCYATNHLTSLEEDAKRIRDCIQRGHESILEHASATFAIGCSRVVTHELVRHRIAAYSQRSQRYVNESEPSYFTPPEIVKAGPVAGVWPSALEVYELAMDVAWRSYRELLVRGVPKQIARYVLPNACLTTIWATWNFREIRHIIKLRAGKEAQPEMQEVAKKILAIMLEEAPSVFGDLADRI
jgi:thymidylate synthase (FAD)